MPTMKSNFPNHIAIIMDGNRRWAKKHRLTELEGHRKGVDRLINTVEEANELGVKYITVYAISTENYKERSREEIGGLLYLLKEGYEKHRQRLKREGIRLNFIGNIEKLPKAKVWSKHKPFDRPFCLKPIISQEKTTPLRNLRQHCLILN